MSQKNAGLGGSSRDARLPSGQTGRLYAVPMLRGRDRPNDIHQACLLNSTAGQPIGFVSPKF